MRTTLDIDNAVLAIARQRAAAENISIGKALSNLALRGYQANAIQPVDDGEFLIFPGTGKKITPEMVDDAIYD